ncbi:D-inositol-3-phosphate glycosyltransferase [subsurface metagenome]
MKKILFIITQSEFGGAQRAFFNIAINLNKEKYKITVAAGPEGDNEQGFLSALEKRGINTKHLKYLRREINPLFDFWGLVEIRKLIKKERPETLFLGSTKAGFLGSLAGYLVKVSKIIYRIGGWTFNDPLPDWKKKLYIKLEKWSARFKDIIINNAEADRKQGLELGIKAKKRNLTIYNGIDVKSLKFLTREKAREELINKLSKFFTFNKPVSDWQMIGTIANLYPSKGLKYLIETANILVKKYPRLIFMVIGEGRERKNLMRLIKKYRLENKFFLVGLIPDAYKYLKAFDIFVLPSVKEGFPWTILEAMAAEVPIVATEVSAIPEVLKNNQSAILVKPKNPKRLTEVIESLIKNPELKEKLIQQARETVEKKFTLEKLFREIEKLF